MDKVEKNEIVYIDDDMRRGIHYVEYLELEGYKVKWFEDDAEALEYIENYSDRIFLFILDMIMISTLFNREETKDYYNTGKHLLAKIRKIVPSVPVIVFSIRTDVKSIEGLMQLGVKQVLVKDETDPPLLSEKVSELVGKADK